MSETCAARSAGPGPLTERLNSNEGEVAMSNCESLSTTEEQL